MICKHHQCWFPVVVDLTNKKENQKLQAQKMWILKAKRWSSSLRVYCYWCVRTSGASTEMNYSSYQAFSILCGLNQMWSQPLVTISNLWRFRRSPLGKAALREPGLDHRTGGSFATTQLYKGSVKSWGLILHWAWLNVTLAFWHLIVESLSVHDT